MRFYMDNQGATVDCSNSNDSWTISATNPFNGQYYPTYTGNGYFAARIPAQGQGFSKSHVPTSFQIQGFYTATSDSNQWRVGGPAWTGLKVADASGTFDDAFESHDNAHATGESNHQIAAKSADSPASHNLSGYRQTLHMKNGTITTSARWTSPSGNVIDVDYTVLPSRANDQLGLVHLTLTPIAWNSDERTVTVTDVLDPQAASNASFDRWADPSSRQIALTTTLDGTHQQASFVSQLDGPGILRQSDNSMIPADDMTNAVEQHLSIAVEVGKTYEFTKFVGLATNQDVPTNSIERTRAAAASIATEAAALGFLSARSDSDKAWAALWQGDILISGDDLLQSEVRASRFYLLASVGERPWSPSPAGLSSDSYAGHVFWDSETWMWPSLLAQDPGIAKAVLQYRANRLGDSDGAKFNALHISEWNPATQSYGQHGYGNGSALRFPWEGGLNGKEQTTALFFGGHEIHITADIALACWQYYETSGDTDWLINTGYGIIAGSADFWIARSYLGVDHQYHIDDVTPPDEWSSNGEIGRDDSAYTNLAASKVLEIACQAAAIVGETANPEWRKRSGNFAIPEDSVRNVTKEYANYDGIGIKQADAVMLSYPWENEQSLERTANNLDYYSTKVNEDASPSMTDAIHSIVAAEIGRADEAMWYTKRSSTGFMRGPFNQFTEERGGGSAFTFLTGAGGFLQEFYYGYTGLRWRMNGVTVNPILPSSLSNLTVTGLHYQGSTFDIEISPDITTVSVTEGRDLTVIGQGIASLNNPLSFATRQSLPNDGYGRLVGSISASTLRDQTDVADRQQAFPTAETYTPGSFDLSSLRVFEDGNYIRFVTSIEGQILNPWALEGMSLQLLHIYIRSNAPASTAAAPGVQGTGITTAGAWQYVAIANPREHSGAIGATGLFTADGTRIARASLSVRQQRDIVLTIPAEALQHEDLSKAAFQVSIFSAVGNGKGVNNIEQLGAQQVADSSGESFVTSNAVHSLPCASTTLKPQKGQTPLPFQALHG